MESERSRGKNARRTPTGGTAADTLGRLVFRMATQLFGGRMRAMSEADWRHNEQRPPAAGGNPPGATANPIEEAARVLEQALGQAEALLGKLERRVSAEENEQMPSEELGALEQNLQSLGRRLEEVLGRLTNVVERFSDDTVRLAQLVERLELWAPAEALEDRELAAAPLPEPEPEPEPEFEAYRGPEIEREPEPARAQAPLFHPSDQALGIVIAAVPGFQGLMDVQRGLSALQAVEGAPVRRYKDGEALLEVALRAPVSATQIVERLEYATGRPLLIEEARPEALRLRLRFIDGDGGGISLNSERAPTSPDPLRPSA